MARWKQLGYAARGSFTMEGRRCLMSDRERIGVIGAGNVGTSIAKRLVPQGHEVMLCFTLNEAKLASKATSFGAAHGTVAQMVAWADVVALAVPWSELPEALAAAGDLAQV
jgi:8-hydroxy-5-deazaflavin:NADPH oxidoreductase